MLTNVNDISGSIIEWLKDIHPTRNPDQVWAKLEEELAELRERPSDGHEWADVLILILDLMDLYGIDPVKAIHWKMEINRNRDWNIREDGTLKHIKKENRLQNVTEKLQGKIIGGGKL